MVIKPEFRKSPPEPIFSEQKLAGSSEAPIEVSRKETDATGHNKKKTPTPCFDVTLIEDYAQWIIDENPDILILDGPPTCLFGYMVIRNNLQRAIDTEKGQSSDS